MNKLKVFEMFSGYGGASFALKEVDIEHEVVGFSEIDKYAIQCWEQNHTSTNDNYGDAFKIDEKELPDFDLLTGGFPCQTFSTAGKRAGFNEIKGTLIYEILRIAKHKKPKYMLLENVKGLTNHDNGNTWRIIRNAIREIGYDICFEVLNSKDYGIPQNRERIWIVCKLGKWDFMEFQFPRKEELKLFVKDILEENPDKKYNLSEHQINKVIERSEIRGKDLKRRLNPEINSCLTCGDPTSNPADSCFIVHSLQPRSGDPTKGGTGHLSKDDGTTYCLDTGNSQCLEISPCLTTELSNGTGHDWTAERFKSLTGTWRKLTPRECFRLQGFLKDEIILDGISNSQLYKLAGNGWDKHLVSKIFKELYKNGK